MMFSFLTVYVSHKSESHCRGTAPRGCAPGSGELWIPGMAFRMNTPPTTLFSMNDLNQNLLICLFSSHLARPFIRVWEKDWVKYSKMETKQWNGSLSIHHNHVMFLKRNERHKNNDPWHKNNEPFHPWMRTHFCEGWLFYKTTMELS